MQYKTIPLYNRKDNIEYWKNQHDKIESQLNIDKIPLLFSKKTLDNLIELEIIKDNLPKILPRDKFKKIYPAIFLNMYIDINSFIRSDTNIIYILTYDKNIVGYVSTDEFNQTIYIHNIVMKKGFENYIEEHLTDFCLILSSLGFSLIISEFFCNSIFMNKLYNQTDITISNKYEDSKTIINLPLLIESGIPIKYMVMNYKNENKNDIYDLLYGYNKKNEKIIIETINVLNMNNKKLKFLIEYSKRHPIVYKYGENNIYIPEYIKN